MSERKTTYTIGFNAQDLMGLVISIKVSDLSPVLQKKIRHGVTTANEKGLYSEAEYKLINKKIVEK